MRGLLVSMGVQYRTIILDGLLLSNRAKQVSLRDNALDIAKGLAIILVVLGHTLQSRSPDFDEILGFRLIYSFHMPLFAFLAGAAAVFWIENFDFHSSVGSAALVSIRRIKRSAISMLIPFISWTLVGYVLSGVEEPFSSYMLDVFAHSDRSLWFLPCIFWCTTYTVIYLWLATAFARVFANTRLQPLLDKLSPLPVQMLILLGLWTLIKGKLPPEFGLIFANGFHGGLFVFFALGAAFYRPFSRTEKIWLRVAPYVLFLTLAGFWHRTLPDNLSPDAPSLLRMSFMANNFPFIVAISGSLAVIDFTRLIAAMNLRQVNATLSYLGSLSLAIYAIHFYALGYWPPVAGPLAISVALYLLLSKIPFVKIALFGK